ncbi:MAG: riboflavin synthase, partial [Phycisphaerae bacterium]|nr:riboflavin synthase [Phycisphaerae bacterium]
EVRAVRRGGRCVVEFAASEELTAQMVPKGSVAVDGVSLTLVDVTDVGFSVALIPETLAATTLGGLHKGDKVNIEVDILGKYVRRYVQQLTDKDAGGLTVDKLKQAGFM